MGNVSYNKNTLTQNKTCNRHVVTKEKLYDIYAHLVANLKRSLHFLVLWCEMSRSTIYIV